MDGTPADDIRKVLKAGQKGGGHSKAAPMPLACPWRREGEAGGTTAQRIDGSASTVCGWLSRMHRGGLGAGYDRAKPGRPRRIDPKLRGRAPDAVDGQPEGRGAKPNVRTGRLILIMLSGAFGVNGIPPGTACRTAHEMGRSYKKPGRPLGRRTPSGEAKEEFEADPGRKIAGAAAGFGVFWFDESHFSTRTIRGMTLTRGLSTPHRIKPYGKVFYHILSKREPPLSIPHRIKPYGKRCTRFAVPGVGGLLHRYCDRGNAERMTEFVTSVYGACGKTVPMDDASHHKSKEMMEPKKFDDAVRMIYLPPYSPDLNPVEAVWKESTSPAARTGGQRT